MIVSCNIPRALVRCLFNQLPLFRSFFILLYFFDNEGLLRLVFIAIYSPTRRGPASYPKSTLFRALEVVNVDERGCVTNYGGKKESEVRLANNHQVGPLNDCRSKVVAIGLKAAII